MLWYEHCRQYESRPVPVHISVIIFVHWPTWWFMCSRGTERDSRVVPTEYDSFVSWHVWCSPLLDIFSAEQITTLLLGWYCWVSMTHVHSWIIAHSLLDVFILQSIALCWGICLTCSPEELRQHMLGLMEMISSLMFGLWKLTVHWVHYYFDNIHNFIQILIYVFFVFLGKCLLLLSTKCVPNVSWQMVSGVMITSMS